MKKIVRLNEGEFNNLVKEIIEETHRFNSQDEVDRILDKINSQGIDSLTDEEKYIINNPDEEFQTDDSRNYDDSHGNSIIYEIIEKGLVRKENVFWAEENVFVINSVETDDDVELPYFALGDSLVLFADDENKVLTIDFDAQVLDDEVMEVFDYIVDVWEPQLPGIKIVIELNR